MFIWMILKVAIKSLTANKLRSVLAMLGIIIGVAAVIAMLAIGAGAQQQVLGRITSMGTNLLVLRPGQRGTGGVVSGTQQNMTLADAQALINMDGVKAVAPVVSSNEQIKYQSNNTRTPITGSSPTYFAIRNFEVERGQAFTDAEVDAWARVAVIGPATADKLFAGAEPLEQTVKIRGVNFRVIGVLKSKGDQGWFNPDDQVIIPYTTLMKQLLGVDYLREIDVQGADGADLDKLQASVRDVMRTRHRLLQDAPDDVEIRNQADLLETASGVTRTFTVLLGTVAGISLLVGGIGIMNIMLVTVTERTREIGIRKAIGAHDRDILRQFLIEALIMSGAGGLLGAALGIGSAQIIGAVSSFAILVEPMSVILALSFSAGVGIFFGYYPASRAAKLEPIVALRYE